MQMCCLIKITQINYERVGKKKWQSLVKVFTVAPMTSPVFMQAPVFFICMFVHYSAEYVEIDLTPTLDN